MRCNECALWVQHKDAKTRKPINKGTCTNLKFRSHLAGTPTITTGSVRCSDGEKKHAD